MRLLPASTALFLLLLAARMEAQQLPPAQLRAVTRGLDWLVTRQHTDGHWESEVGNYSVAMTGISGMALLLEGSTPQRGKYRVAVDRAVRWLLDHGGRDGRVGESGTADEARGYLWGHGYGLLFLACAYEQEKKLPPLADGLKERFRQRSLQELRQVLERAVVFSANTQTSRGGWGYFAPAVGSDFDEAAPTAVQVQALLAACHAGVAVPQKVLEAGLRYLKDSVLQARIPGETRIQEQAPVLWAALAITLQAGGDEATHVKQWLRQLPKVTQQKRFAGYRHYYESQARYLLGDQGHARLLPGVPAAERLTWTGYRASTLQRLIETQRPDGSWPGFPIGSVYETAANLMALQLDRSFLPFYRRKL
jgi:hypothetical protein